MKVEQELKLALPPAAVAKLKRHPLLRAAPRSRTRRQVSIYFDTADHWLLGEGAALRVRKVGRATMMTLKAEGETAGGMSARPEWEAAISRDRPDLAAFGSDDDTPLLAGLRERAADLEPAFVTDIGRTLWVMDRDDGTLIEAALDVGEIRAGGRSEPVCELELELKSGASRQLFELAEALLRDIPMRLESRSKSARGYRLALGDRPGAEKAAPVALDATHSTLDAFRAVVAACLRQLDVNEPVAELGDDPEGVHQMRVATRRLRSAVSVFRRALPDAFAERARDELRWFAQELGPARDWDVFLGETVAPLLRQTDHDAGLATLARIGERRRRDGYERARAAIAASRYASLKLLLARAVAVADEIEPPFGMDIADLAGGPVLALADRVLKSRHRKLLKSGDDHRELTLPELHELRIRAKKMRYAAEFFRRLYGRKPVKRYLGRLASIQESLGAINDSAVARLRLEEARADVEPERAEALARAEALVIGWHLAKVEASLADFADLWRRFSEAVPFWGDDRTA